MLGQYGFLSKVIINDGNVFTFPILQLTFLKILLFLSWQVLSTFEKMGISVDVVATSEVSVSLTLDPSKFCSKELIQQASFIWVIDERSTFLFL